VASSLKLQNYPRTVKLVLLDFVTGKKKGNDRRRKGARDAYQPSGTFTILELLRVRPLGHELVRRVEIGGKSPLAIPEGRVPQQGIFLCIISICDNIKRPVVRTPGNETRMNVSDALQRFCK
jgi:hypothetical protein